MNAPIEPPKVALQEKLMAIRLNCSFGLGRVTDKAITHEVNTSKHTKALKTSKDLFPEESGKHLRHLKSTLAAFYAYHKKVTMEGVNEGERLLPVLFYMDWENEFGAYQVMVNEAFADVVLHWDNDMVLAQQELKGAYNPNDYPHKEDLHQLLKFQRRMLRLPPSTPILDAVGNCIQTDVDGFLTDALQIAYADVTERFKGNLQRMVEVLSNPKGRVFDSLTENLAELVSFVPSFNVTEDASLNLLCDEVKTRLLGVGVDALRTDQEKRKATADAAYEILKKMGG